MPKVHNLRHRLKPIPLDAVLVDRSTPYGNPFIIGRDGTRSEVIAKFEKYAKQKLQRDPDWLKPLRGKDLVCWCAPDACHGDVLLKLANEVC